MSPVHFSTSIPNRISTEFARFQAIEGTLVGAVSQLVELAPADAEGAASFRDRALSGVEGKEPGEAAPGVPAAVESRPECVICVSRPFAKLTR